MKSSHVIALGLIILILNAGITLVLVNAFSPAQEPKNQSSFSASLDDFDSSRHNAITRAVAEVEPAVVSVNVIKTQYVRRMHPSGFGGYSFFDFFGFFGPTQRQVQSLGSGVIYDPTGLIITNSHVVEGATEIKVVLPDNREFDAQLIGIDSENDIAKLRIKGNNLPFARLGDSDDILVGEWCIALGNPYGYVMNDAKPTVSVGVISALGRNLDFGQEKRYNMIQTDAAINQGNSGGALVNIHGEVIGINNLIISESGGNIGLGFAIPINSVKEIVDRF